MENTENNYISAWFRLTPDENAHLQPCYSQSSYEIFKMEKMGPWSMQRAVLTH